MTILGRDPKIGPRRDVAPRDGTAIRSRSKSPLLGTKLHDGRLHLVGPNLELLRPGIGKEALAQRQAIDVGTEQRLYGDRLATSLLGINRGLRFGAERTAFRRHTLLDAPLSAVLELLANDLKHFSEIRQMRFQIGQPIRDFGVFYLNTEHEGL